MSDIVPVRSTIAANGGKVIVSTGGQPVVGIELEGTWVGTVHIQETVSGDGFVDAQVTNAAGVPVSAVVTGNGKFFVAAAGRSAIQVIATAWTSGTATVVGEPTGGSAGQAVTVASLPLPAGAATDATVAGVTTAVNTLTTQSDFDAKVGSLTETPPATDVASSGLNGRLQRIAQRLTSLIALLPAALGSTTAANSLPVTLSTDGQFVTSAGSLTETAPATDTASSGLNGRLQRVAQRLTSLIALLPTALISNRLDVNLGAAPATVTVGGAAAAGAAVAGNPVLGAVSDGTNAQTLRQAPTAGSQGTSVGAAYAMSALWSSSGNAVPLSTAAAAGDGNNGTTYAGSAPMLFNGATRDSLRNNLDVTLLASAARTTTQSGTITTYNLGAIKFILDMTVITAGPSVTLTISETDLASGKTILLLSGAAVVTAVTNEYTVDPAVPAVANVTAQKRVPRTVFWQVTANNANSGQYSLGSFQLPA